MSQIIHETSNKHRVIFIANGSKALGLREFVAKTIIAVADERIAPQPEPECDKGDLWSVSGRVQVGNNEMKTPEHTIDKCTQ